MSVALLAGGVVLERRALYKLFARGLISAGWAALYFTTYAMHAVDAARVITSPVAGGALLFTVAVGIILHSLRYRVQGVTGVAYFSAFASLALAPSTSFAVVALIPLAGSLLYLAQRFDWRPMALLGLIATYGTCASRGDTGAPLASAQALFAVYWVLFEASDILHARHRVSGDHISPLMFPLNAIGFLGLSFLKWSSAAPQHLSWFAGGAAVLYLASALIRARVRPPSSFEESDGALARMSAGGYEGAITLAAILAGLATVGKARGVWKGAGLAIGAELFFLAGVRFGERYLRQLAAAGFAVSLGRLAFFDLPEARQAQIFGRTIQAWTPVALLQAALFYLNRYFQRSGWLYGWTASALAALILAFEVRGEYLGLAWLALSVALFEFGLWRNLREFRWQAYAAAALGTAAVVIVNVAASGRQQWLQVLIAAAVDYASALRAQRLSDGRLPEQESRPLPWAATAAAVALLMCLIAKVAPEGYLGIAWLSAGCLLYELGLRRRPAEMRVLSCVAGAAGVLTLMVMDVFGLHKGAAPAMRNSLAAGVLVCGVWVARMFSSLLPRQAETERRSVRDALALAGTLFALSVSWLTLPDAMVAMAWAVVGLALAELGFATGVSSFRLLGAAAALAAVGRLFFANFTGYGQTLGISHRLLTVTPVLVTQYYLWWRYRAETLDWQRRLARVFLWTPAVLAMVLLRFELGRVLAVTGWAAVSVALLFFGLRQNLADLRWQSYLIALLTFVRSWTTSFYAPESFGAVPARILTGALVIAAFYACQMISPRSLEGREGYARLGFSLLGSLLASVLLYYEVSGSVLTVAWGIQGVALLVAGFPLLERTLRLSGLSLLLVCILKLFVYDLRNLGTPYRILSFIALGVILLAVSWVYTRFRDRLRQYL